MAYIAKGDARPKGRRTAYAFFVLSCREEHKKKHPEENVVFGEFSKECASRWKSMSDEDKSRFKEMADKDKQRYDNEMLAYTASNEECVEKTEELTGEKRKHVETTTEHKQPPPNAEMALDAVTKALKKIAQDDSSDEKELDYFCVEDSFLTKDMKVSVDGVGNIIFPISETDVQKMIQISSKAVFGKGEKTVLDTNVRDTQTIPESKLKVDINERSLAMVLERIGIGLNIDKNCTLVPHLYNMLIYGPGQFFQKHRDSEKIPKMVATLVVVLPSPHKGGDLIIEHNDNKHTFFGSQSSDIVKCIAFYSDCSHEIKKVTEGYRIALTFNVVLNSPKVTQLGTLDKSLKKAVKDYFRGDNRRRRLIFYMNHSYSKCSLKWGLLKGSDRTRGHALYVVASKVGLLPYLALVEHQETYEVMGPYHDDELSETSIKPYFWVRWDDKEFMPSSKYTGDFDEEEICYTIETTDLLEPYKTERDEEPYGNAPETEDRWYRRACVVLLRGKKLNSEKRQCREETLPCQMDGEKSKGAIPDQITEASGSKETIVDQTNNELVSLETVHSQSNDSSFLKETLAALEAELEQTLQPVAFYRNVKEGGT